MGVDSVDSKSMDRSWRDDKKSIKAKLNFILNTKNAYQDVTFIVGKGKEKIQAHKLILIIASPVFEEMLQDQEYSNVSEDIQLPDIEPVAFRSLLKFAYTDTLDEKLDVALPVLYAAKKFEIPELSSRCSELLKRNITEKNVIEVLKSGKLIRENELIDAALQFILRRADSILSSSDFLNIQYEDLCTILECDELFVDELKIFKTVLRWASEECKRFDLDLTAENQRYVLKQIIYLIRFPLMTVEQFSVQVVPTGILSQSEMLELYQFFTTPEIVRTDPKFPLNQPGMMMFNVRKRIQRLYQPSSQHRQFQHDFVSNQRSVNDLSSTLGNITVSQGSQQQLQTPNQGILFSFSKQYNPEPKK